MTCYISILRGINVGGQKQIRMDDLKALYESMKFKDVITYIQSGNVIFKTDIKKSIDEISGLIEKAIYLKDKFHVPLIIRPVEEMFQIVAANPFLDEDGIKTDKIHVTFLSEKPKFINSEIINHLDFSPDRFKIIEKEIYLYCPEGYGKSKLSNNFFESKLKVTATTRNWSTVNKLVEMANN
jgi:uncharacterized protein (DUF1697 family)